MKKHVLFFVVLCVCCISFTSLVFADEIFESNHCVTQIGNPQDPPPLPLGCDNSGTTGSPAGSSVHPTPPDYPANLRQAIADKFGIFLEDSVPAAYDKFAWEKLWDVSNTKFDELARGLHVSIDDTGSHREAGRIFLRSTYDQRVFNIIFIHEASHEINDKPDQESLRSKHWDMYDQDIENGHKGVTGYGEFACTYSNPEELQKKEEDYADMLAYYLNPGQVDMTSGKGCDRGVIPYADGKYPLHYQLAQEILGAY